LRSKFSELGVLRLHGLDFALQVRWLPVLSRDTLFSALPGLGSETATVLFGRAAGGCPQAEVVKNVADVNANATEALLNARGIDT
jgi:hypothetical protein